MWRYNFRRGGPVEVEDDELSFAGTDRFHVVKVLGKGGMGAVYQAFDRERHVDVALKTLLSLTPEGLLRFKEEFRALQDLNLNHPNLVGIGELFGADREWFFTMELVDGVEFLRHIRPISQRPRREVLPDAATVPRLPDHDLFIGLKAPSSGFDEGRLRACLPQLVAGIDAVHAAGKVHRDVKPSNILVTREGRVVLLDFGLIVDVDRREQLSQRHIAGTVAYMAPEQAAGEPVSPAADWYALGVVLYEALTGIVPFMGPALEVMTSKQHVVPQSPRSMLPQVPADLDALTNALLRIDPRARPDAPTIFESLGMHYPKARSVSLPSATNSSLFIGREPELRQLHAALQEVESGAARVVYISGESGVGKTSLVRRFTDAALLTTPAVRIFEGRCYEHESVPFKAVDSLIDNVSRHLMKLPAALARSMLPPATALLAQVFPVLRRVEAIAEVPHVRESMRSPQDQRQRLFAAMRELFLHLAQNHPSVLVIDDLQWADADSLAMLAEIMRDPAPPLLLLATLRTGGDEAPLANIRREIPGNLVTIDRLGSDDARELASVLIRRAAATDVTPERIAQEAGGHPQFIDELVRYAQLHGVPASGSLQLEEALWSRVARLDPRSRRLMEVVALAVGPMTQDTAAHAAEMDNGHFPTHTRVLRAASLVRTSGSRSTDHIEPYHDRVRRAVRGHLDKDQTRAVHRRIALALETSGKDNPAALATHWLEAGDRDKAFSFGLEAAENARRMLAFDRAAHFYALCLEQAPPGTDLNHLRVQLAEAWVNAGRGGDAAVEFLRVAAAVQREQGDELETLELQRRAAEQLLRSGRIDEGLSTIGTVMRSFGYELPKPSMAILSLLLQRARVRLRGLGFRERAEGAISRADLQRIDICWSLSAGLGAVDSVVAADFQARHLLLALKAGEPYRVVRALAMEVVYTAAPGTSAKRTHELLTLTRALAEKHPHPHGSGLVAWTEGSSAFMEGRWRDGFQLTRNAEETLREHCTGVSWELDTARFLSLWCSFYLGDLGDLFTRVPVLVREAEARGDSFAITNLRTSFTPFLLLAVDDVDGTLREVEEAMDLWSRQGFHVQHYNALFARVAGHLYRGEPELADRLLAERWADMKRAQVFFIQQMKFRALHLRAAVRLATVTASGPAKKALLQPVVDDARGLEREGVPWGMALAGLLRAGVARAGGDDATACQLLENSAAALEGSEMSLYAAAARRHLGTLLGGERGRALVEAADAMMNERRILDPARFAVMLVPGVIQ
jgi:serine/threonine protein kinase